MYILLFFMHRPLGLRAELCVADGCELGYCAHVHSNKSRFDALKASKGRYLIVFSSSPQPQSAPGAMTQCWGVGVRTLYGDTIRLDFSHSSVSWMGAVCISAHRTHNGMQNTNIRLLYPRDFNAWAVVRCLATSDQLLVFLRYSNGPTGRPGPVTFDFFSRALERNLRTDSRVSKDLHSKNAIKNFLIFTRPSPVGPSWTMEMFS